MLESFSTVALNEAPEARHNLAQSVRAGYRQRHGPSAVGAAHADLCRPTDGSLTSFDLRPPGTITYPNFPYSTRAAFKIGKSGSATFHN